MEGKGDKLPMFQKIIITLFLQAKPIPPCGKAIAHSHNPTVLSAKEEYLLWIQNHVELSLWTCEQGREISSNYTVSYDTSLDLNYNWN